MRWLGRTHSQQSQSMLWKNADIVGIALEEGLITLIVTPSIYGTKYLISELGLTFLYNMKEQFAKEVFNKFTEGNLDDDKPTKT